MSTTAGLPLATDTRSSAAIPPLPSSCAAIMRSASVGPRTTRTRPTATIRSTKAAAPERNSAIEGHPERAREAFLVGREHRGDGLAYVEAVDVEPVVVADDG